MLELTPIGMNRRALLRLMALGGAATLVAACGPSPAAAPTAVPAKPTAVPKAAAPAAVKPDPAPPAAAPASQPATAGISDADWNALVDAARGEGSLALATYAGSGFRVVVSEFEKAFPGISVEHSQFQSSSRDYVPRLLQEQKADLYAWDIAIMPTQEMLRQVRPSNGIEPIRPLLVRGDLLLDATWRDGFENGFNDIEKKWGYSIARYVENQFWYNTDLVQQGEIKTLNDILDPKWKGKIIGGDPRTKGSGFVTGSMMRLQTGGDEIMKRLYVDQAVVVSTDARQLTEAMVRGRYAIGVGAVDERILADFREQGLGNNVQQLDIKEVQYTNAASNTLWFLMKAPHPNAAKVFVNWVLSKDGSIAYSTNALVNSRRTDVPPVEENNAMVPGVKYPRSDAEELLPEMQKTQDIAKGILN